VSHTPSPLANFSGSARLFPLPGLVFFPRVMQPLHIFEPRYRQMTADALATDRLIAMALPRPGWEEDYDGRPPLHPVACLGRITTSQLLPDGRYNLLLHGLGRVRIVEEIGHDKPYRAAKVELLSETGIGDPARQSWWRQRLLERAPTWFPGPSNVAEQVRTLCAEEALSPGVLCDMIAFALSLDVEFKQRLLEELDDETRLNALFARLDTTNMPPAPLALRAKYPPDFSPN
jgi:Lon protease-like protein